MNSRPDLAIGIIDSGIRDIAAVEGRSFTLNNDGHLLQAPPVVDRLGHGTAMADIILQQAPEAALYNAQVFLERLVCSARQVAAALDWLVSRDVRLINMSFGLREDREVLGEAVHRAVAAGVILLASSPARGGTVWPAAYPGVISATGDARCAPGELSVPGTGQAEFGGHVRSPLERIAGASVGCAHVSALSATYLYNNSGATVRELSDWLTRRASYFGPERRGC